MFVDEVEILVAAGDGCFRRAEQNLLKGGTQYIFDGNATVPPSPAWTDPGAVTAGSHLKNSAAGIVCIRSGRRPSLVIQQPWDAE